MLNLIKQPCTALGWIKVWLRPYTILDMTAVGAVTVKTSFSEFLWMKQARRLLWLQYKSYVELALQNLLLEQAS